MALCNKCKFYSESIDEMNRDYNDIGDIDNHYCPMYQDAIPVGVYNGSKSCDFYEERETE